MATMNELKALCDLGAGSEIGAWVNAHASIAEAWQQSIRADLMMWILGRTADGKHSDSRVALSSCALDCATMDLVQVPAGDIRERIAHAVELHRAYLADPCDSTLRRAFDAAEQALSYAQSAARRAGDIAQEAKASLDRSNSAAAAADLDDTDDGIITDADADRAQDQWDVAVAAATEAGVALAVAAAAAAAVDVAHAVNAICAHAELSVPTHAREDCAAIVRRHYPEPPTIAAMQAATKGES